MLNKKQFMYSTNRLILRPLDLSDIDNFYILNSNKNTMRFFPKCLNYEGSLQLLNKLIEKYQKYKYGIYACLLKNNNEFIGTVGLNNPDFEAHFTPCVEIGWKLNSKYWGFGYALEASLKCLEIGFKEFHLNEILAFAPIINKPSINIMIKLNMHTKKEENFFHPLLKNYPLLAECVLYRISKSEFIKNS